MWTGTWSSNFQSWKSFKFQERYLLVKYEDLIANPEKVFLKILEFIYQLNGSKLKINDENVNFSDSNSEDEVKNANIENCAKILEVKLPVKISVLKKQYKKMVKKFHPDVSKNNNEEHIIKLNYAYSELLNFLKQ